MTDQKPTAMDLLEAKQKGVFKVTTSEQNIPAGAYKAILSRWEITNSKKTGEPFVRFMFRLTESGFEGREFSAIATPRISKGRDPRYNTKLYTIVSTLLQRELTSDEQVNFEELIGKSCKVVISDGNVNPFQGVIQVLPGEEISPFSN